MEPLYKQLAGKLRQAIEQGVFKRGERIPTEFELCDHYGVSRITIRQTLALLAKENLLVRRQGLGTFVADEKILYAGAAEPISFYALCVRAGKRPGAKVLRLMREAADSQDIQDLHLAEDARVVVVERLRFADDSPVIIEQTRFTDSFAFLLDENLDNCSMMEIVRKRHGATFYCRERVIELAFASPEEAKSLAVPKGYPLIALNTYSTDAESVPTHRCRQLIVGDRFKFRL